MGSTVQRHADLVPAVFNISRTARIGPCSNWIRPSDARILGEQEVTSPIELFDVLDTYACDPNSSVNFNPVISIINMEAIALISR